MGRLSIAEIVEKTAELPTREEQITFLRQHDNPTLRTLLSYTLDPAIKWALPPGSPPYTPTQTFESHGQLYNQARKLYLFIEGGNSNIHKMKREALFIQLLESVDPDDARFLIAAKDKQLLHPVPVDVINEAFGFNFPVASGNQSPGVTVIEKPKKKATKAKGKVKKPAKAKAAKKKVAKPKKAKSEVVQV